jgi:hypothetical protein
MELEKHNYENVNSVFYFNYEYSSHKTNHPSNISNTSDVIIKTSYGCYSAMEMRQALN